MIAEDIGDDRVFRDLERLTRHEPDGQRAAAVRARCHRRLVQRATGRASGAVTVRSVVPGWSDILGLAVAAASGVFLIDVLRRALHLCGL